MANTQTVLVDNLCSWDLYFSRASGSGVGDIKVPANVRGYSLLSYDEVLTQIQLRNVFFIGDDEAVPGAHARIRICDDALRNELFGLSETTAAPPVLDEKAIKQLLSVKSKQKFNDELKRIVQTNAEKKMVEELAIAAGAEEVEAWKLKAIKDLSATASL